MLLTVMVVSVLTVEGSERLQFGINSYDYEHYNKLTREIEVNCYSDSIGTESKRLFSTNNGEWEVRICRSLSSTPVGEADDYRLTFRLVEGYEPSAAVFVRLLLPEWQRSDYLLLPAAAYAGNRFAWRRIAYSPKLSDARDIGPDKSVIISDVPRLSPDGPSFIQERSGALALPCAAMHGALADRLLLLTTPRNEHGDLGLNFEELRGGGAELTLLSPVVRERYKYEITDNMVASTDMPARFHAGDSVTIAFRLYRRPAGSLADLFDLFFHVRDEQAASVGLLPRYPFTECYNTIERKFNRQNYVAEWGYYAVGMRENFLQDWQIGWTGGMITTYPLLFSDNDTTIVRVVRNFDWLFPDGLAPSGFFWDSGEGGNRWYGGDIRRPQTANWHLIRKSGDALYYIVKQLQLMRQRHITVKPAWAKGTRGVADAFVRLFDSEGQYGQFVDSQTGHIIVGGSTSGGIVPAALVLAWQYFGCDDYLRVAKASATQMYADYINRGLSCGGPGDALQNPDSESWYAMLESFALLYEATGEQQWLDKATVTAHQFSSWVMAYDYNFPTDCLFGRLAMQTIGAVFANTQNKHGSPGICTHSGLALLRLYRATGDPALLRLLSQVSRAIPQYMSHPDRPVGAMDEGWISERISTTDWFEGIGEIPGGSTWAETAMLLTAVELPSVYVDRSRGRVAVFDHLEAVLLPCGRLRVSNPTAYVARVKVIAETTDDQLRPWNDCRIYAAPSFTLKPGAIRTFTIK